MKAAIFPALLACLSASYASYAEAQNGIGSAGDIVSVDLLDGWREADGRHIAAIRLTLAEGWKTYWRAPGDGGLPTHLQWHHSDNLDDLRILWPRPKVFDAAGMRSLGYVDEVTLPLELTPERGGAIELNARLTFGVCREVCVPAVVDLSHVLDVDTKGSVSEIRMALETAPHSAAQANVRDVRCVIKPAAKGHLLTVDLDADLLGETRAMVVETNHAKIWVGQTDLVTTGSHWHGVTKLFDHRDDRPDIMPEDIRITLLSENAAVDIPNCNLR